MVSGYIEGTLFFSLKRKKEKYKNLNKKFMFYI